MTVYPHLLIADNFFSLERGFPKYIQTNDKTTPSI